MSSCWQRMHEETIKDVSLSFLAFWVGGSGGFSDVRSLTASPILG